MNTLDQWLHEQTRQERHLYLVLDSDGQLEERDALASDLGPGRYRNLYAGTPAASLAGIAPYLFQLVTTGHAVLQALLDTPERHWGWLASAASADLNSLTIHWQQRLVTGERPDQALYRFHDNRVLARALAHLEPDQRPDYLGLMASVCYWQDGQWLVTDNPKPSVHQVPINPAWCHVPPPDALLERIQFDNTRRYLVSHYTDALLKLAHHQDIDAWLRSQLELARRWGWQEPESLHFLLTQTLQAPDHAPPITWLPRPAESPAAHFDRVYREARYWQGDDPL